MCCKNDSVSDRIDRQSLLVFDDSAFQSEGFPDELNLSKHIAFRQPPHLAFPNHVQNLIALNRPPRSIERSKTLAGIHPPLDPLDQILARACRSGARGVPSLADAEPT